MVLTFCATAHPVMTGREVGALNKEDDPAISQLGMLRLLSEVQRIVNAPGAPNLAAWFRRLMAPVIETFHNRATRRLISKRLDALVQGGNLALMVANVDNVQERRNDNAGFTAAKTDFANLAREVAWLKAGGLTNRDYVKHSADQAASVASSVLAGLALVFLTAYYSF